VSILSPVDNYFLQKEEPVKSCLQFLRGHLLQFDSDLTEAWKYGMPFYCIKGKMILYLWVHKKHKQPYIGIVEGKKIQHPDLLQEKRARMKILLIDPNGDVPVRKINSILKEVISWY
jgi:hypothetical protein